MHETSYLEMSSNVGLYLKDLPPESIVVDVGSLDVNGSYKALIDPPFRYVGVDLSPGPNVDQVMVSEFDSGLPADHAAAVISGQCLEHCTNPFLLVKEMFRICKPGGFILLTAPWAWPIHRYPLDCWRFLPDGIRILIESAGGIFVESYLNDQDCWGIGRAQ